MGGSGWLVAGVKRGPLRGLAALTASPMTPPPASAEPAEEAPGRQ